MRLWRNRNSHTVLVEMENDKIPMEGDIIIVNKITQVFTFGLMYPYVNIYLYACMLSHFSHYPSLCNPIDCSLPGSSVHGDSPGKNTGVGYHFLLQCMKVKSESEVAQLCPTPSDSMDCGPPGSSIHGIFQARVLE